jgi:hypothetical protein
VAGVKYAQFGPVTAVYPTAEEFDAALDSLYGASGFDSRQAAYVAIMGVEEVAVEEGALRRQPSG